MRFCHCPRILEPISGGPPQKLYPATCRLIRSSPPSSPSSQVGRCIVAAAGKATPKCYLRYAKYGILLRNWVAVLVMY
jgi:hypothetical protein